VINCFRKPFFRSKTQVWTVVTDPPASESWQIHGFEGLKRLQTPGRPVLPSQVIGPQGVHHALRQLLLIVVVHFSGICSA
jgi:hypothetical protein